MYALSLSDVYLRFDCNNDAGRDLILKREHVGQCTFVTLGPDLTASARVSQLHPDANSVRCFPDTALQYISDAKFTSLLLNVKGFALECECRVPRNYEEAP